MATIKGQNLRLFLDGQVIAAAQSCTLHVAVNMADCSSKDDTNNWQRQEPVGLSWDVSADALVIKPANDPTQHVTTDRTVKIKSVDYSYFSGALTVNDGSCLKVSSSGIPTILNSNLDTVISSGEEYTEWVNNTGASVEVYIGDGQEEVGIVVDYVEDSPITYLEHFEHMIAQKEPIKVQFAQATGSGNAEVGTWKGYKGEALITDISVNSPNRTLSTYTIQLTGTGQLAKETE